MPLHLLCHFPVWPPPSNLPETKTHFRLTRFLVCLPAMSVQDAQLVVRCPYCALGWDFRPLTPRPDGKFVCEQCGHTSTPGEAAYLCTCRKCVRLTDAAIRLENR